MRKTAKKKAESDAGSKSVLRSVFRSFAQLAEQAGEGWPLLKGVRVARLGRDLERVTDQCGEVVAAAKALAHADLR